MPSDNRNKFPNTHTLKIPIILQAENTETEGFIFDYTGQSISLFCSKELANGANIKIVQVKGKPVSPFHCKIISFQALPTKGTVISPNFPMYKICLAFDPQSDDEKKLIESLLKEFAL